MHKLTCDSSMLKMNLIAVPLLLFLLISPVTQGQNAKTLTEADYQRAAAMLDGNVSKFIDQDINPQWLPDGRLWYQSLTETKETFVLFNPANGRKITADTQAELFGKTSLKPEEKTSRNEVLSPDGRYVAFIRDWNLWMREVATGKEKALTTDGIQDFGYATDNAGWKHSDRPILSWSPDSKKIATFQQDQRQVHDMYLVRTKVGAPELQAWKYPLPGDFGYHPDSPRHYRYYRRTESGTIEDGARSAERNPV